MLTRNHSCSLAQKERPIEMIGSKATQDSMCQLDALSHGAFMLGFLEETAVLVTRAKVLYTG